MIQTTKAERDILEHSLGIQTKGGKKTKGGYRNYFAASKGTKDFGLCLGLVEKGLMVEGPGSHSTLVYFHVSENGKLEIA